MLEDSKNIIVLKGVSLKIDILEIMTSSSVYKIDDILIIILCIPLYHFT